MNDSLARVSGSALLRRVRAPYRDLEGLVVVARPMDGSPVVLAPTAALVWSWLEGWSTVPELEVRLASAYPDVEADERASALRELLEGFDNDGLLERG